MVENTGYAVPRDTTKPIPPLKKHPKKSGLSTTSAIFSTPMSRLSSEVLDTPIDSLPLPHRVIMALHFKNISTLRQAISLFNEKEFFEMTNVGKVTIQGIKEAVKDLCFVLDKQKSVTTVQDAIDLIFYVVSPANADIIKKRFGWDVGKLTLKPIAEQTHLTRQRVLQIINGELDKARKLIRIKAFSDLITNYERFFQEQVEIASVKDFIDDPFFNVIGPKKMGFVLNLLSGLYEDRYFSIGEFYTKFDKDEISQVHERIKEVVFNSEYPVLKKVLLDAVQKKLPKVSRDYLSSFIDKKIPLVTYRGQVLSPAKLTMPEQMKIIFKKYNRPVHYTEMAKMHYKYYSKAIPGHSKCFETTTYSTLNASKDFLLVAPGTFILRERFKVPSNWDTIVDESRTLLKRIKEATDAQYILNELHKKGINTGDVNRYNLKPLLLEERGFVSCGKFVIGIEKFSDKYKKNSLGKRIYEIVSTSAAPLRLKDITALIGKQKRVFVISTIAPYIYRDTRLIKIKKGTYGVDRHIKDYAAKKDMIITFASQWLNDNPGPMSSFLATELLKDTYELKDFPVGLVDHVLINEPGVECTARGFYSRVVDGKY